MRSLSLKLLPVVAAAAIACGDVKPCSGNACPKMEGNWVFGYTARAQEGTCTGVDVFTPPGTLTITRAGASIGSSTGGIELTGTIYDDGNWVLRSQTFAADGGSTSLYYRGSYIPGGSGADGGTAGDAQLSGSFTATSRSGGAECRQPSDFTAVR